MCQRVSECLVGRYPKAERFWDAGLNADGSRCLIFADCDELFIWDVRRSRVEWVFEGPEAPEERRLRSYGYGLGKLLEPDDFITIREGPGADRYRIFGKYGRGRTVDNRLGLKLEVAVSTSVVRVVRLADSVEVDALTHKPGARGWYCCDRAAASFSEDGSLFAVIAPYYVTFFSPTE